MPPAIPLAAAAVGAAVAASPAVVAAVGVFGAGLLGGVAAFGINALGSLALGARKRPRLSQGGGAIVNDTGGTQPQVWVYGRARVGGARVATFATGAKNQYLHVVIVLAGHEIDGVEEVFLGEDGIDVATGLDAEGEVLAGDYAGVARFRFHLGTADQEADAALVAEVEEWTTAHRLRGRAYLYARLRYDRDVFPSGLPTISAVIRGKRVFDPRTGVTAWSANWALCCADYLRHRVGVAETQMPWLDVAVAASISDELVTTVGGGSQRRYRCNGSFVLEEGNVVEVMEDLLNAGAGSLTYTGGAYRLFAGAYRIPTLDLDARALRGAVTVQPRAPRDELFNGVAPIFINPNEGWRADAAPEVLNASYVAEDGGAAVTRRLELPFEIDAARAQRLARIQLERGRQALTVELALNFAGMAVQIGETFRLSLAELGWTQKVFRAVGWALAENGDGIDVVAREDAPGIYAWDADETTRDLAPNTVLPSARQVAVPTDLVVTPVIYETEPPGDKRLRLDIAWTTSASAFVTAYDVQHRLVGAAAWTSLPSTDAVTATAWDVPQGDHEVRVRARNGVGVTSPWLSSGRVIAAGDEVAPGAPSSLVVVSQVGGALLRWTNAGDTDLTAVQIAESAAAGAIGTVVATASVRPGEPAAASLALGPATTRYYRIRSVDRTGNRSAWHPAAAGIPGSSRVVEASDLAARIIGESQLQGSLASRIDRIDATALTPGDGGLIQLVEGEIQRTDAVIARASSSGNLVAFGTPNAGTTAAEIAAAWNGAALIDTGFADAVDGKALRIADTTKSRTVQRYNPAGRTFRARGAAWNNASAGPLALVLRPPGGNSFIGERALIRPAAVGWGTFDVTWTVHEPAGAFVISFDLEDDAGANVTNLLVEDVTNASENAALIATTQDALADETSARARLATQVQAVASYANHVLDPGLEIDPESDASPHRPDVSGALEIRATRRSRARATRCGSSFATGSAAAAFCGSTAARSPPAPSPLSLCRRATRSPSAAGCGVPHQSPARSASASSGMIRVEPSSPAPPPRSPSRTSPPARITATTSARSPLRQVPGSPAGASGSIPWARSRVTS